MQLRAVHQQADLSGGRALVGGSICPCRGPVQRSDPGGLRHLVTLARLTGSIGPAEHLDEYEASMLELQ